MSLTTDIIMPIIGFCLIFIVILGCCWCIRECVKMVVDSELDEDCLAFCFPQNARADYELQNVAGSDDESFPAPPPSYDEVVAQNSNAVTEEPGNRDTVATSSAIISSLV